MAARKSDMDKDSPYKSAYTGQSLTNDIITMHLAPHCDIKTIGNLRATCKKLSGLLEKNFWQRLNTPTFVHTDETSMCKALELFQTSPGRKKYQAEFTYAFYVIILLIDPAIVLVYLT